MNRAWLLVSVAGLCGACSSDGDGGGNDGVNRDGVLPPAGSAGSAAVSNPGAAQPERPAAPPLTVASLRPESGASQVALDAVIEIRFSAALDAATATASNIVVQGPNGPLEGELTVEGELVRFTPASKLPLLSPVRVRLGTALASSAGGLLAEPVEAEFLSRDGAFRQPQQVNSGAAASLFLRGNDAGNLIATWTDLQVTSSVEAMLFDAELGTWTAAQPIENDAQLAFSRPVAAMAPNGDSIVAWRGGGWTRYAGSWSSATVGASISLPSVALGADAALSVSNAMAGASYQLLPNGANEWSAAQTLLMGGQVNAIDAVAGAFLAIGTRNGELVAGQLSAPGGSWSEFAAIGTVRQVERMQLSTHGDTAAVAWLDLGEPPSEGDNLAPVKRPTARVFTGETWSTAMALPDGAELPWISAAAGGRALAVWRAGNAIHASSHSSEQGWSEPQQLAEQSQLAPAGAIDGAGNLLALWPSSQQILVQRQAAGGDWNALEPVDSEVSVSLWSHVDGQGRVNLVWQNGTGIWWTRFE
ncbi:MAG TPA: Ig-like domain-containing protein [Polyangiaceae bacterium]|nr:Ig-like domain-containing protein [Polyangiaceae bacterium]